MSINEYDQWEYRLNWERDSANKWFDDAIANGERMIRDMKQYRERFNEAIDAEVNDVERIGDPIDVFSWAMNNINNYIPRLDLPLTISGRLREALNNMKRIRDDAPHVDDQRAAALELISMCDAFMNEPMDGQDVDRMKHAIANAKSVFVDSNANA